MLEKTSTKIQNSFMITPLPNAGIEGAFLNLIKALCQELTADIICKEATLEAFSSSQIEIRQGCRYHRFSNQHNETNKRTGK